MDKKIVLCVLILISVGLIYGSETLPKKVKTGNKGYRIDQPGMITFTIGVKIKGKVERPQVVIILSKEKSHYREIDFNYSFHKDIVQPLPFFPIIE